MAEAMTPLLQVRELTRKFGGLTATNAVSFDVQEHEILSVIGPNGAGKSTLFKLITSFLPTTSGDVLFRGERISDLKPHIVARKGVVRTFQETNIFRNMTVRESVIVAQHLRSTASLAGYFIGTRKAKLTRAVLARERTKYSPSLACQPLRRNWPAICRRATCAPWASQSACRPIRSSCCWTSRLRG